MTKDLRVYLNDILQSIDLHQKYTDGKSSEDYENDNNLYDAVHRRLEIIGEAVRHIPDDFRVQYPEIPWKAIAGMRDVLIHEYFEVNTQRIWKTVTTDLPKLKRQLKEIL